MLLYRSTHIVLRTILLIYVQWKRAHCLFFVRSTNWMQQKLGENEWRRKTAIVESSHNNSNDKKIYIWCIGAHGQQCNTLNRVRLQNTLKTLSTKNENRTGQTHACPNKQTKENNLNDYSGQHKIRMNMIWGVRASTAIFKKKHIEHCFVHRISNAQFSGNRSSIPCVCMHQIFKLNRWNFSFNPFITHGIEMNAGKKA